MINFLKLLTVSLIFSFAFSPQSAEAHSADQGYLYLRIYKDAIGGRFELVAQDINKVLGTNLPANLTMADLQPHLPALQAYFVERSSLKSDDGQTYTLKFTEPTILELNKLGNFVRFHFDLEGVTEVPEGMDLMYNVLFDKDPKHRGMLIVEYNWKAGIVDNQSLTSGIFSPDNTTETLSLTDVSIWKGFVALVKLGIWHIWIGLDHILFIVALILPSVVRRRKEEEGDLVSTSYSKTWAPVDRFKPAFLYIIKIVTFFTIAHSITLALAALGIINLSSRIVETIIAISIALAAFHNIKPIFRGKEWAIAFAFGLFHGFGFASVLGEKGLSGDYLVPSLLGFNVGVEIGQVLIICMVFPVLYLIRKFKVYPKIITYGSMLLIFIALYWAVERGFETDLTLGTYFWKAYNSVLG